MLRDLEENVSRESLEKLRCYDALLHKWQKTINLVSRNTLNDSWERHILDSVQVATNVSRESSVLYDLGSGGGFPGLAIAMLRPDLDVHLIESDQRKCSFLKAVSRETETPVTVHNARIEDVSLPSPDVVTARALASLDALLGYCAQWANPALYALFLKGARYEEEIAQALVEHDVEMSVVQSKITDDSAIVRVDWK